MLLGCSKKPADHPVDAYLAFARSADRDPKAGFEALSKSTREVLQAKVKALSEASGGSINDDPAQIFFSRPGRPAAVGEVKLLEQKDNVARLQVSSDGKSQEVKMVREDARWRVDLSELVGASTEATAQ